MNTHYYLAIETKYRLIRVHTVKISRLTFGFSFLVINGSE